MLFLLAANERLKPFVTQCLKSLDALGYQWIIFDLGGLGFGEPYPIQDDTFNTCGYYKTSFKRYASRGMHKPQLIMEFIKNFSVSESKLVVYLDADTFVRQRIDEIVEAYDVGVTVRHPREWKLEGKSNAGVMFFRATKQTHLFLQQWICATQTFGNDQKALNSLLANPPCSIREFPARIYNWYYFPKPPPMDAKILHFKNSSRLHNAMSEQIWASACIVDKTGRSQT